MSSTTLTGQNLAKSPRQMPPRMPVRLWQEMDGVEKAWKNLLKILKMEWDAIKNNDIDTLWSLIEEKEKAAASVATAEKQLANVADRILSLCKNITQSNDDKSRWDAIIELANPCEVMRLEAWRINRFCLKEEARIRLEKHTKWLEQRKNLAHEMLGLLMRQKGAVNTREATYGPSRFTGKQPSTVPNTSCISHLSV